MAITDWIDAAAGFSGALLNQFMPLSRAAKQAHQLNVEETMRQEARQEEFFNNYQSIGAQVRQMKGAGINPALAAGGISAGSPVSGPSTSGLSPQSADASAIILDTMRSLQDIRDAKIGRVQRAERHEKELEEIESRIRKNKADAEGQENENSVFFDIYNKDMEKRTAELQRMSKDLEKIDADIFMQYTNISKSELEQSIMQFDLQMKEFDAEHQAAIFDAQQNYQAALTASVQANTKRTNEDVQRIIADTERIGVDKALKEAEKLNLEEEHKVLVQEAIKAAATVYTEIDRAFAETARTAAEASSYRMGTSSTEFKRTQGEMKKNVINVVGAASASAQNRVPKKKSTK